MNCATHNDTAAVAFCRTCGKPLCANCTRDVRGVVYCEPCLAARLEGTLRLRRPDSCLRKLYIRRRERLLTARFARQSGPNPAVAGILAGFFPFGVGAVYCSQYAKGLAHLLIFGLLIFGSDHAGSWDALFGIGIAFFYVYQIIDAVRTAHASKLANLHRIRSAWRRLSVMGEKERNQEHSHRRDHPHWAGRALPAAHHEHLGVRPRPFLAAHPDRSRGMDVRQAVGISSEFIPAGCTCATAACEKPSG